MTPLEAWKGFQAVGFLDAANVVTWLDGIAWDKSSLLSESSIAGRVLHTLIGYMEQPTQLQVLTYVATIIVIAGLSRKTNAALPSASAQR